jgi:hypothetical protein
MILNQQVNRTKPGIIGVAWAGDAKSKNLHRKYFAGEF